ncbi:alpha/beta hydrolase [Luteimonas sp. BDR2-5]|uniref:esterase/lipase family protein n=1 Tax=Proluteimonas luteida TaxID=2878685 RepID=UPI001E57DD78|nr:alpha/beta fold hydrolase [Luteimonas sp. BDR2-5]MCD9027429.1 alpha/beta hydrolase [Luteimonas sp. BDR2-5]
MLNRQPTPDDEAVAQPRRVILLHGIWMVGATMRRFAAALRAQGFAPEIFGYHSITGGPESAVEKLLAQLDDGGPAHLVGHSLGGLVALQALGQRPDAQVGRVVCVGSPLCGSGAAAALARLPLSQLYFGRSADILLEGCATWPAHIEVGMIAGTVPHGLGALFAKFDGPHDGTVALDETRTPALADHIVVEASHSGLLFSAEAMRQTGHFLRAGRFAR